MTTAVSKRKKPVTSKLVAEHLKASRSVMKLVLSSKRASVEFLIGAGLLEKSGKKLAKPYR